MVVLYSKTAQYSILSMLFIAANQTNANILVRDIAKELSLPASFLSKILQSLSRYGFLNSVKGPRGGFSLSERGAAATIQQLVEVVDGPMDFDMCIAGFSPCTSENACPLHDQWKRVREDIRDVVGKKSITKLAVDLPAKYKTLLLGTAVPEKTKGGRPKKAKPVAKAKALPAKKKR